MTRNKEDYELARDLVLAAFIILNEGRIPTDRGKIGQLQIYLNINKQQNGDIRNLVSTINDPRRAAKIKLNPTEVAAYRRALAIVESLRVESEEGWVDPAIQGEGIPADPPSDDLNSTVNISNDEGSTESKTKTAIVADPAKKPGRKRKENPVEAAVAKKRSARTEEPCCS